MQNRPVLTVEPNYRLVSTFEGLSEAQRAICPDEGTSRSESSIHSGVDGGHHVQVALIQVERVAPSRRHPLHRRISPSHSDETGSIVRLPPSLRTVGREA